MTEMVDTRAEHMRAHHFADTLVMDVPEPLPKHYDVLLTDVCSSDLKGAIAKELKVTYLGDAPQPASPPPIIHGILFGKFLRSFVPMTVSLGGKTKTVIFLVNTGSPYSYLCQEVC
jgi:hypothetical protein